MSSASRLAPLVVLTVFALGSTGCEEAAGDGGKSLTEMSTQDQALVEAAVKRDLPGLKKALADGANPNATGLVLNDGPPIVPLARHGKEFVAALLEKGADPNKQRKDGDAALHTATIIGDLETVALLLDKGADPNLKNKAGYTPVSEAAYRGHAEILKALLAKGGDLAVGGQADGLHLPFDRAMGKSVRSADVEASRPAIVATIIQTQKPDQKRLDMAAASVAKWEVAGPHVCAVGRALVDAGAEKTAEVQGFLAKCPAAGGAPPAP